MARPQLNPTKEQRDIGKSMAAMGIPHQDIALKIVIRSACDQDSETGIGVEDGPLRWLQENLRSGWANHKWASCWLAGHDKRRRCRRFVKTFLSLVELCRAAWSKGRLAWVRGANS